MLLKTGKKTGLEEKKEIIDEKGAFRMDRFYSNHPIFRDPDLQLSRDGLRDFLAEMPNFPGL